MKLSCFNNPESIQKVSATNFYNILLQNPIKSKNNVYTRKYNEKLKGTKNEVVLKNSTNIISKVKEKQTQQTKQNNRSSILLTNQSIQTQKNPSKNYISSQSMNKNKHSMLSSKAPDSSRIYQDHDPITPLTTSFFRPKSTEKLATMPNLNKSGLNTSNAQRRSILKIAKDLPVSSPTAKHFKGGTDRFRAENDYNDLIDRKILSDVRHIGERYLNTISLRRNSPARYDFAGLDKSLNKDKANKSLEKSSLFLERGFKNLNSDRESNILNKSSLNKSNNERRISDRKYFSEEERLNTYDLQTMETQEHNVDIVLIDKDTENNENNENTTEKKETDKDPNISANSSDKNYHATLVDSLLNILDLMDHEFEKLSIKEIIEKFLLSIEDTRKNIRLGGIVALYIIKQKNMVVDDLNIKIMFKVIEALKNFEIQDELFLVACFELLSNIIIKYKFKLYLLLMRYY